MATRTIIGVIRSIWGGDINNLIAEHNKLVDEVEELKAAYKVHTHSATSTKAPDGSSGTGFTPAFTTTDAQKIG
jgi:hypothetical protein